VVDEEALPPPSPLLPSLCTAAAHEASATLASASSIGDAKKTVLPRSAASA
jgi:hypothetical protein